LYGLELASLEVICPRWRHRHPAGGAYPAQAEVFGELLPKRLGAFISKKYIQCSYKQHTAVIENYHCEETSDESADDH